MLPGDPFDVFALDGEVLDGQYRVQSAVPSRVRGPDPEPIVEYRGDHMGVPIGIECLRLPADIDAEKLSAAVEAFLEGGKLHHRLARGHPAIAQSIAVGSRLAPRTGMIVPYLVREWIDGESLAEELGRPLTVRHVGRDLGETLALFEPIAEALGYAHAQQAAHLALGPRTLFIEARGDAKQLKILDFGIGRAIDRTLKSRRSLSPEYAAPELLEKAGPEPGPPADVYALARILRDVLSGVDLPRNLEVALARATDRIPDRRPKDATQLWEEMTASLRAPAVAGAVPPKGAVSAPAIGARTVPMSFEALAPAQASPSEPPPARASDPPPVHVISKPPPAHIENAPLPAVIVDGRSPERLRSAERTVLIQAVAETRSRSRRIAVTGVLLTLAAAGAAFFFGALRHRDAAPTAAVRPVESSPSVPVPSADPVDAAVEPSAAPPPAPPTPAARFPKADAKAALDAAGKDLAHCKKGKGWGAGSATVVFANDGSVQRVVVGPPFGSTGTGVCVAEALQAARIGPFLGKPGVLTVRFVVPSH